MLIRGRIRLLAPYTDYLKISESDRSEVLVGVVDGPRDAVAVPDFSFGNEVSGGGRWADAARMIVTPTLTSRLSVMADPMMETYVAADKSNVTGLFNGIEPMYWIPPYTEELVVPVQCTGPAGRRSRARCAGSGRPSLDWSRWRPFRSAQELEDFRLWAQELRNERIQQRVEQPWIRLWDGNWHYRGVLASEISGMCRCR